MSEPRYTCKECWDRGIVTVINPRFIEWFRPTYDEYQASTWPDAWQGKAYHDWRSEGDAPMIHTALCECRCKEACNLRKELDEYRAENRSRPPACGLCEWVPRVMPLLMPSMRDTLIEWYSSHVVNESAVVTQLPGSYSEVISQ